MIVSASRRTDIPAFHSGWLNERLTEGFVEVRNPFNPNQIRRVDLRPAPEGEMEALILWTRNPAPLIGFLHAWEARGVRTLFQVTLTGYPPGLETDAPKVESVVEALGEVAAIVGRERIIWRYDPVFASKALGMDAAYHRENFSRLADALEPFAGSARISVYDEYARARRRLERAGIDFDPEAALDSVGQIARVAKERALPLISCCEEVTRFTIAPGGCIDGALLKRLWGIDTGGRTDPGQRTGCLCAPSVDIGSYDTCSHGCLYCYARKAGG